MVLDECTGLFLVPCNQIYADQNILRNATYLGLSTINTIKSPKSITIIQEQYPVIANLDNDDICAGNIMKSNACLAQRGPCLYR